MAGVAMKAMFAALQLGMTDSARMMTFESFVEMHGRSYSTGSSEFEERRALYQTRLVSAEEHNSQPNRLWTAGVNKLWDWTESELKTLRGWDGSAKPSSGGRNSRRSVAFLQQTEDLPEEKMWSHLAMAHRVKNQADCGSCWAIAAASVLEGHAEIHLGQPRTFSAQQIVECTPNPQHCGGDGGCKGATAELAMEWVLQNGCDTEDVVPYTGRDGQCGKTAGAAGAANDMSLILSGVSDGPSASGAAAFGMTGWETLPKNKYEPLLRALAERGPVAVSVAADSWFDYDAGVFNGCSKDAVIDHAVTAIGYGTDNGEKYWMIQNSWGADWGEEGHIRLQRHDSEDDHCGMNNDPQKGVACQGDNAPVPVCGMCGVLFDSVVPHFG